MRYNNHHIRDFILHFVSLKDMVIIMKSKFRRVLNLLAVCFCTGIIFIGCGYLYLNRELTPTENKSPSVPYYPESPENKGVMFEICKESVLFFLNFENSTISVLFDDSNTPVGGKLYGYDVDYKISGDYDLLAGIIDIAGGIELKTQDEVLRYTGVQVSDLLSRETDRDELVREIILVLAEKISEKGFQNKDFLYIIENSQTNLTVPDCYYWPEYINNLCSNVNIIN